MAKEKRFKTNDNRWRPGKVHRWVYDPVNRMRHTACKRPHVPPPQGRVLDDDKAEVTCRLCNPSYKDPEVPEPGEDLPEYRILVCGSRTFSNKLLVTETLNNAVSAIDDEVTIIHGAARGADTLAAEWAEERDVCAEAYPAEWNKYGKRAGYIRNSQMLEEGKPNIVIAFVDKILEESKGTAMMVNLAKKHNVGTVVVSDV